MAYKLTNHDTLKNMNITNNNDDRKQLIKVHVSFLICRWHPDKMIYFAYMMKQMAQFRQHGLFLNLICILYSP